jgi:putative transposase
VAHPEIGRYIYREVTGFNDRRTKVEIERRKKVKHFDIVGDAHFLTFSCYRRMPLLSKDRMRRWFVESLQTAREKHGFDLWAWVIMPEHVHLLVWPRRQGYSVAKILASIKKPVGYKAVQYLEAHAPKFLERLTVKNQNRTYRRFWQAGPGVDNNLYEPNAIHNAIEYIHNNPIRRGLVARQVDFFWSSARDWEGHEDLPIKVDRTVPMLTPDGQ